MPTSLTLLPSLHQARQDNSTHHEHLRDQQQEDDDDKHNVHGLDAKGGRVVPCHQGTLLGMHEEAGEDGQSSCHLQEEKQMKAVKDLSPPLGDATWHHRHK